MKKTMALLFVATLVSISLLLPENGVEAGEAKQEFERIMVGQWKIPKNKYKNKISFEFTRDRKFECVHEAYNKEAVNWSGNWKVRTTSSGTVKAFLKARNQTDPEKYMKAVIRSDPAMENLAIRITFNFKSKDKSSWQSKLKRTSDGDDEDDEDFDDEDDEDFDDEYDEDFDDEDDEDFDDEDDDDDLEKDEE